MLVVVLADDYTYSGALAVAMAVGNLVATITLFNVRPFQVTDVNGVYSAGEYVGFRFLTAVVALLACFGYSLLTVSPECATVVAAYALFKAVDSFVDVLHGVDQLASRLDYAGQSQIIRGVLILVAFVFGMVILNSLVASVLLMAAFSFFVVLMFDARKTSSLDDIWPKVSFSAWSSILKSCFPGFAAALLCAFVVSYSRQWFGMVSGSELLGVYAAIATPAVVVQAFAGYVYSPLLGPIAKMWHRRDYSGIKRTMTRFVKALIAIEMLCFGLYFLAGHEVLVFVYGDGVSPYTLAMLPVLVCTGMTATMIFLVDLLISFRLGKIAVLSGLVASAACVVSVPFFVETWGMNGISYSITVSFVFGSFWAIAAMVKSFAARGR